MFPVPDSGSSSDDVRARVVAIALNEVGERDPYKYWREVLPVHFTEFQVRQIADSEEWCGGFALWCLRQAGLARDIDWELGQGFCFRLPRTTSPEPGDVAYFDRNQHHAIVAERLFPSDVLLVNGNAGSRDLDGDGTIGETVNTGQRPLSDAAAYFSIQGLIDDAEARA